jgi:DNA-binding NarL/FixJ family response regulator
VSAGPGGERAADGGPVRVLIADDHPLVREGLRTFLGDEVEVLGEACDGEEAVRLALELRPDVLLLDLRMPHVDGVEATRRLRDAGAPCRVLILTSFSDEPRVGDAVRAGALGYLLKDVGRADLLRAVRDAARGVPTLHPSAQEQLLRDVAGGGGAPAPTAAPLAALTRREREVLRLVARGESNKRVAAALGLSEGTVKSYLSGVFEKLGVGDRTQAALWAVRNGMTD